MNAGFEELLSFRIDKDSFMRNDIDSPIPPEDRANFTGLKYFLPNEEYRVTSRLERFDKPIPVVIMTSTGTRRPYLKYGTLTFQIKGTRLTLVVYKSSEDPYSRSLFVPFSDGTSGGETYGSGRYLDLDEQGGDDYELDFNMAYNPYCAYSAEYTCPLPPSREQTGPQDSCWGEELQIGTNGTWS
jgi:uncharacterized protein